MKRVNTVLLAAILLCSLLSPFSFAEEIGTDADADAYAELQAENDVHDWGEWSAARSSENTNPAVEISYCKICGAKGTRYRQSGMEFQPETPSFSDVKAGDYFYDPVIWAVKNEITNGTSESIFSPGKACTRAEAVTLMWRANGCEKPAGAANPFRDVADDAYYHDAVLWACSKNITKGVSGTEFDPNARCTRGQIVTFLWRLMGEEEANTTWELSDVDISEFYYMPVKWALRNNIAKGTEDIKFSPKALCTRAQIVTFLYRNHFNEDVNKVCQQEFIDLVASEVEKYAGSYGIKTHSAVIAQCILETGWGKSQLCIRYHNYFGIKCGSSWRGGRATIVKYKPNAEGVLVRRAADFRAYDSIDDGFKGYFSFLQNSRYRNLRGITNPYNYLKTILADGYTESSDYADRCYVYVTNYNLTKYDPR